MPDIRINQLPTATGPTAPAPTDFIAIDGSTTRKSALSDVADAIRPIASQAEAEAGTNAVKAMTPLTTKQSIASEIGTTVASASQGALASTALQPSSIGNTVQAYSPTLTAFTGTLAQSRAFLNIDRNMINDFGAVGDGATNDNTAYTAAAAVGTYANPIDGQGKVYLINAKPPSFAPFKNAAFKVGSVIHPTKDFLPNDTAKVTNGLLYTGWAQDKCYKVGTQLRVWVNVKESHTDGTGRIGLYISDDGGSTWSFAEYLAMRATGNTLWSAGFDGTNEYLFVRVPSGSTDVPPYTYQMWKRALGTGASQNYNGAFTKTNITFPSITTGTPWTGTAGANGTQPVMVHSFSVGHSSSIVVGASYQEGSAIMRSTDGGINWTAYVIGDGSTFEEPTVKWIASTGLYCGFMRYGGTGNPRFWASSDNFATAANTWTAPAGYFGSAPLSSATVTFDVDDTGTLHAVTAYRNGVIEGAGSDDRASTFYLRGPALNSNIWANSATTLFCLGQMQRREQGGASALGQGSVICNGSRIHLFYGMEGRTGTIGPVGVGNRVSDIYATTIFRTDYGSMLDERVDLAVNRSVFSPLNKVNGIDAWVINNTDASNRAPMIISGRPNSYRSLTTTTIASDTLTLTGNRAGLYVIDTEAAAATDNLATITDADAQEGDEIILETSSSARDVIVQNAVGNILCGTNQSLDNTADKIKLMFRNSQWHMISFANNA